MTDDGMQTSSAPLHPEQRETLLSSLFWTELAGVVIVVGVALFFAKPVLDWFARVHAPAPVTEANGCRPPTDHEVLLIGVAQRKDGLLVITGCTHTAGKGAYVRRGAP